jgi:hypothetical protein
MALVSRRPARAVAAHDRARAAPARRRLLRACSPRVSNAVPHDPERARTNLTDLSASASTNPSGHEQPPPPRYRPGPGPRSRDTASTSAE